MKTAVSLPDDLFRWAEATPHRLRVSRSELYAKAIAEFLDGQRENAIRERLNEIYSRRLAKVDSALHRAQLRSLGKGLPVEAGEIQRGRSGGRIFPSRVARSLDTPSTSASFKP